MPQHNTAICALAHWSKQTQLIIFEFICIKYCILFKIIQKHQLCKKTANILCLYTILIVKCCLGYIFHSLFLSLIFTDDTINTMRINRQYMQAVIIKYSYFHYFLINNMWFCNFTSYIIHILFTLNNTNVIDMSPKQGYNINNMIYKSKGASV